ncbi:MAG: HAD hydrolase family protein [Pirellulales bacterium]
MASLDREHLQKTLDVTVTRGHDAVLYADTFDQGFDYYYRDGENVGPEMRQYFDLNEGCGLAVPDLYSNPPAGVFAGFAMGSRDDMLALDEALQRKVPERLYTHVIRSPRYDGFMCEIAPAGATKWSGVRFLADQWGIADEEIVAVGDDVNDLPMLAGSGLGIAMGNAVAELKDAADHIAPHHDDDGLAEVVRWILQAELPPAR